MDSTMQLAEKVIAHWIRVDYGGDKDKATADLCNPNRRNAPADLAACQRRVARCIEDNQLFIYADDINMLASEIEFLGY